MRLDLKMDSLKVESTESKVESQEKQDLGLGTFDFRLQQRYQ